MSVIVCGQSTTLNNCNYPNVCYTAKQDSNSIATFIKLEKQVVLSGQQNRLAKGNIKKIELQEDLITEQKILIKKKNKDIIKMALISLGVGAIAILK